MKKCFGFPAVWRGPALQFVIWSMLLCHAAFCDNRVWWISRGVVDSSLASDDYAELNVGQLKHMAAEGRNELNAFLPGGAGSEIDGLVNSWSNIANADDYALCTIGQLKAVAKRFWDRLIAEGRATTYPWTATTADDDDFAIANVGQLKKLFDLVEDVDLDGLEDGWELQHAGNLTSLGGLNGSGTPRDSEGDGLTDAEEYFFNTEPGSTNPASPKAGNFQVAPANSVLSKTLIRYAGPSAGLPVVFTVDVGGGKLSTAASGSTWQDSITVPTNAAGFAQVYWRLGKHGSTDNEVSSVIGSSQPVLSTARSADLVAHWKLDEGSGTVIADSSGTGYNATVSSLSPNPWETSFEGSGSIKGVGQKTEVGKTDRILTYPNTGNEVIKQSGPFTISFWFKADAFKADSFYWLACSEQHGISGFRLGIDTGIYQQDGNRVRFSTSESGGNVSIIAPVPIITKRWYNLSVVHTGTLTKIYIDWVCVASASGSIQRGTNQVSFVSCAAGQDHYELEGEVDDIKIYTAAITPVAPLEVAWNDRLMLETPLELSLSAVGESPTKGTANGAGRVLLYKPYELSRGIDVFTYQLNSTLEQVPVAINIAGPSGGVSARPRYQRTVIVHKGSQKQFDLEIDNPDQHSFTITSVALSSGPYDYYDYDFSKPPEQQPPPDTSPTRVGTVTNNGVHVTYQAPSTIGEIRLTYTVHDGVTNTDHQGTVVIHSVRPIYLTANPTRGAALPNDPSDANGSSINWPYHLTAGSHHTDLIANLGHDHANRQYTIYYYEPGTYTTHGYRVHAGINSDGRLTANDGCKHYHVRHAPDAASSNVNIQGEAVIRLVESPPLAPGNGVIFATDGWRFNVHGFEVRGLTLDANAVNNSLSANSVVGAIGCFGSNVIVSDTRIIGCGGLFNPPPPPAPRLECFPILFGKPFAQENIYSEVDHYENVIIENCTVEQPAAGSKCGFTALLIVPPVSNGVIRKCTVRGLEQGTSLAYAQGGFASLVEDCTFSGPTLSGIYMEPPAPGVNAPDFESPIIIRRNRFENVANGLLAQFLGNAQQHFAGGISFEDNLVALNTPLSGAAYAINITQIGENPGYIEQMHLHGNVIRTWNGATGSTNSQGFSFGFCTNDEEAEIGGVRVLKIRNVDCGDNVFRLNNDRELIVHQQSTPDAFSLFGFVGNLRSVGQSPPQLLPVVGDNTNGTYVVPHPTIGQTP